MYVVSCFLPSNFYVVMQSYKCFFTPQKIYKSKTVKIEIPDLTHSELEICRLIVQGKKLDDIARLLNKSTSNINTQRSNIRRKLELKAEDNLCDFIVSKIKDKTFC